MVSVTQRISKIKQPRGGYIKPKEFTVTTLEDDKFLHESENVHPVLIGMVVDYLTRFSNGLSLEESFRVSLMGANLVLKDELAQELLPNIKGLDDQSIINACKMVGFDTVFRAGPATYKPVELIHPNSDTIENVKVMVNRSLNLFKLCGPVVKDGFNFEGGYTETVNSGDGDFLTEDTLWDFKVSKSPPTNKHTLQLLMYYLMGIHSVHPEFKKVKKLGIFNPRLNKVFLLPVKTISDEVIDQVNTSVIEYKFHDKQLRYVIDKYIIPEKEFDFNEIKTREEFDDTEKGFKKFNKLTKEEVAELLYLIRNGNI